MADNEMIFGAFVPQGWKMELASIDRPAGEVGQGGRDRRARRGARLRLASGSTTTSTTCPVPAHEAMFECWTTLAAISQRTSRVRLGQMVGCAPYRNPGLLAKITSNIDVMLGRPARLGHRRGLVRARVRRLRLRVPRGQGPHRRVARDRRDREVDVARGRHAPTTASSSSCAARSATRSRCSSRTRRSGSAAAVSSSRCGSWPVTPTARNFGGKPDEFAHKTEVLQEHCKAVGRDYDEITKTWSPEVFVRETEQEVIDAGQPSASGASRSTRGATATSSARPSRSREKIRSYSGARVHRRRAVVRDYPEHRDPAALRREGDPELPLNRRA